MRCNPYGFCHFRFLFLHNFSLDSPFHARSFENYGHPPSAILNCGFCSPPSPLLQCWFVFVIAVRCAIFFFMSGVSFPRAFNIVLGGKGGGRKSIVSYDEGWRRMIFFVAAHASSAGWPAPTCQKPGSPCFARLVRLASLGSLGVVLGSQPRTRILASSICGRLARLASLGSLGAYCATVGCSHGNGSVSCSAAPSSAGSLIGA